MRLDDELILARAAEEMDRGGVEGPKMVDAKADCDNGSAVDEADGCDSVGDDINAEDVEVEEAESLIVAFGSRAGVNEGETDPRDASNNPVNVSAALFFVALLLRGRLGSPAPR